MIHPDEIISFLSARTPFIAPVHAHIDRFSNCEYHRRFNEGLDPPLLLLSIEHDPALTNLDREMMIMETERTHWVEYPVRFLFVHRGQLFMDRQALPNTSSISDLVYNHLLRACREISD